MKRWFFFIIAVSAFIVDRLTKLIAVYWLDNSGIAIIGRITYNTGVAFGFLEGFGWLSIPIAVLVIIIAGYLFIALKNKDKWSDAALGLLAGGAFGNLYDRFTYGYVVDFIDLKYWPVFNIADSCIVSAVIILAWRHWLVHDEAMKKED